MKSSSKHTRGPEARRPAARKGIKAGPKVFRLRETLAAFATVPAPQLPDDLAANHDYYLYGLPKQKPRIGRWFPRSESIKPMSPTRVREFTNELLEMAGETHNLPPDLADNHNHYLHGAPKQ